MKILAHLLHLENVPERAYYDGLNPEEQEKIECILDKADVQTFQGFNYWAFERRKFDGKIMIKRFSWDGPRYEEDIDAAIQFLNNYYHFPSTS